MLTIVLLITLFFAGGLVPNYLLIRRLGLIDTRWALILPLAVNGFYIIIARNFLMTIDPAYEDAALVDGAGYPEILARIIVPLSKPIIATLALWTAVAHWNAWFDALIYIRSERKIVLQTLLRRMIQQIQEALLGSGPLQGGRGPAGPADRGGSGRLDHPHHRPDRAAVPLPAEVLHQGHLHRVAQGLSPSRQI